MNAVLITGDKGNGTNTVARRAVRVDTNGHLIMVPTSSSTGAWQHTTPTGLIASRVISSVAGFLKSLTVLNTHTGTLWLQIFNSASVPADATVPEYSIPVGPNDSISVDFDFEGAYFDTGISACLSSTAGTKTVAGAVGKYAFQWKLAV